MVANVTPNVRLVATAQGDPDGAIVRYRSRLAPYMATKDRLGVARTYHNLGRAYADKGDVKNAADSYERALELVREEGDLGLMSAIYLNKANLSLGLADYSVAASYCGKALEFFRELGNNLGVADTYKTLGVVFTRKREWITAERLLEDSLAIHKENDNPLGEAQILRRLAELHKAKDDLGKARKTFNRALSAFRRIDARTEISEIEEELAALRG